MKRLRGYGPLFVLAAASACNSKGNANSSASQDAGTAGTASCAPGGRTVHACSEVVGGMVPQFGTRDPTWSRIPSALQRLPPGATFCGTVVSSDHAGYHSADAILIADLSGQNLYNFYSPLVTSLGCTLSQPQLLGCDQVVTFHCGMGSRAPGGAITSSGTWTFVSLLYNSSQ
jgi:hypothetical protein